MLLTSPVLVFGDSLESICLSSYLIVDSRGADSRVFLPREELHRGDGLVLEAALVPLHLGRPQQPELGAGDDGRCLRMRQLAPPQTRLQAGHGRRDPRRLRHQRGVRLRGPGAQESDPPAEFPRSGHLTSSQSIH